MIKLKPSIKKATRKEAAAKLRGALMGGETDNGFVLMAKDDVEAIYKYFLPALPKIAKTNFEWVAKAAAKNHVREAMNYVHVANGVAEATDGHRLHRAPVDLPDGFYDPKGEMPVDGEHLSFPDTTRIWPSGSVTMVQHEAGWETAEMYGNIVGQKVGDTDTWLQSKYVAAAVNGESNVMFYVVDKHTAVRGDRGDGRVFVIMPVKTE